jgi:DNA-binding XRE family transcriptional regulator
VREARLISRATQAAFASAIGLSRDRFASIELGRVALRFVTGLALCRLMNLNPLWLAFGETRYETWFVPFEFGAVAATATFSEVMSRHREQYLKAVESQMREKPYLPGKSPHWEQLLSSWNVDLSEVDSETLRRHVRRLVMAYPVVKNFFPLTISAYGIRLREMKDKAASELGKRGRGVPKRFSRAELARRTQQILIAAARARAARKNRTKGKSKKGKQESAGKTKERKSKT